MRRGGAVSGTLPKLQPRGDVSSILGAAAGLQFSSILLALVCKSAAFLALLLVCNSMLVCNSAAVFDGYRLL